MEEMKKSSDLQIEIPSNLLCPLTRELMEEPVMLVQSGNVYEKKAILQWIDLQGTDPVTNSNLIKHDIVPVHSIRSECQDYQEQIKSKKKEPSSSANLSPMVKVATELELATKNLQENQKQLKELELKGKGIDDELVQAGNDFMKKFNRFFNICDQMNKANVKMGQHLCVDNILKSSSEEIKKQMQHQQTLQKMTITEAQKVKNWIVSLLLVKNKQNEQNNILNPVKKEEKQLMQKVSYKQKEFQDLTAQLIGQNNIQHDVSDNPISTTDVQNLKQQKEATNHPTTTKNLQQGKKKQTIQPQKQANKKSVAKQNTQKEKKEEVNRLNVQPIHENDVVMEEMSLQVFLEKLSKEKVVNAIVQFGPEDCARIICQVETPVILKGVTLKKPKDVKSKHIYHISFEGRCNISIEDCVFDRVEVAFNGITHKTECNKAVLQDVTIKNSQQSACCFQGSNAEMKGCSMLNYHQYGVWLQDSTVHYDKLRFNKKIEKQVYIGPQGEWIQINQLPASSSTAS